MIMDDGYIKGILLEYQKTGENLPVMVEYLSPFIYTFPKIINSSASDDMAGEYYNYFVERLPRIIQSYVPIPGVLFKTWFFLVQKRHFYNFLKVYQQKDPLNHCQYFDSINLDVLKQVHFSDIDTIVDLLQYLEPKDLLFLKLFCPEMLTKEDVKFLVEMMQCSFRDLMDRLDILFSAIYTKNSKKVEIKIVPVVKVAEFLGWHRLKVYRELQRIKNFIHNQYIWEN